MPYVFDVYGTLLDVDSAARLAASEPGMEFFADTWPELSAKWRARQLSHSWLRTTMQQYINFWEITEIALDVSLAEMGLDDPKFRARLLSLYTGLSAYDDALTALDMLRQRGQSCSVLSNGPPDMLEQALASSGMKSKFDHVLSVDSLQLYKPDPAVYQLVLDAYGCKAKDVIFFSSNHWDISGAGSFGFKTIWVNRAGQNWEGLPTPPSYEVATLTEAVALM